MVASERSGRPAISATDIAVVTVWSVGDRAGKRLDLAPPIIEARLQGPPGEKRQALDRPTTSELLTPQLFSSIARVVLPDAFPPRVLGSLPA